MNWDVCQLIAARSFAGKLVIGNPSNSHLNATARLFYGQRSKSNADSCILAKKFVGWNRFLKRGLRTGEGEVSGTISVCAAALEPMRLQDFHVVNNEKITKGVPPLRFNWRLHYLSDSWTTRIFAFGGELELVDWAFARELNAGMLSALPLGVNVKTQFNPYRTLWHIANLMRVVMAMGLGVCSARAAQVTLAWDPNPESDISGYRLYYGFSSGSYLTNIWVGNVTNYTVIELTQGVTYYFAVTAVNTANLESDPSNEVSYSVPLVLANQAPTFTKGADILVGEGAPAKTVTGWATAISPGAASETSQQLTFLTSTPQTWLFADPPQIDAAGTLVFTPATRQRGTATVTVYLHDDGGTENGGQDTSAPQTFQITLGVAQDSDGDGLPDDHEIACNLNPQDAQDGSEDADGDGSPNYEEFCAGTHPHNANDLFRLTQTEEQSGGQLLRFTTVQGKSYCISRNEDYPRGSWIVIAEGLAGTGEPMEFIDPSAGTLNKAIYKVSISSR